MGARQLWCYSRKCVQFVHLPDLMKYNIGLETVAYSGLDWLLNFFQLHFMENVLHKIVVAKRFDHFPWVYYVEMPKVFTFKFLWPNWQIQKGGQKRVEKQNNGKSVNPAELIQDGTSQLQHCKDGVRGGRRWVKTILEIVVVVVVEL